MNHVTALFNRMDAWRHLPSYQLERRADLFFALYLPQVLKAKLGFAIRPELIPEFPVRIGTVYPHRPINRSFNIDYLALSADADKAVFVELKTEDASRRSKQDNYLLAAQDVGLSSLLEGLLEIFRTTNYRRKYFCLLEYLADMGLVRIPMSLSEIMTRPNLQGATAASREIEVTSQVEECLIVYVQPNGIGPDIVSFREFQAVVQEYDDPISQRFAQALSEWAQVRAGMRRNPD
jgi:hypothetical protein